MSEFLVIFIMFLMLFFQVTDNSEKCQIKLNPKQKDFILENAIRIQGTHISMCLKTSINIRKIYKITKLIMDRKVLEEVRISTGSTNAIKIAPTVHASVTYPPPQHKQYKCYHSV